MNAQEVLSIFAAMIDNLLLLLIFIAGLVMTIAYRRVDKSAARFGMIAFGIFITNTIISATQSLLWVYSAYTGNFNTDALTSVTFIIAIRIITLVLAMTAWSFLLIYLYKLLRVRSPASV